MNIILIGYSALFITSFILDFEKKDYFFKSFVFNIIFIIYFTIYNKPIPPIIFILSESLFLFLTLLNRKVNYKIFLPFLYSFIVIFSLKFIFEIFNSRICNFNFI